MKVAKEVKRDDEGADFDSFRDEVLDNYMDKGCYAVYDYNWKTGGVNKQKLIFISCVSDELPIRKKMMYGSSKEQVKAKLDGVAQKAVHVTDADDLTEEALQSVF